MVAAVDRRSPVAVRRAEVDWRIVPGTAANDTTAASATGDPRRTVDRRVLVIGVVAILDPLPDVAHHVIEGEFVGRE